MWTLSHTFQAPRHRDGRFGNKITLSGNYAIVGSEYVRELFIYRYINRYWVYQNRIDTGVEALTLYGNNLILCDQHFTVTAYSLSVGGQVDDDMDDDIASHTKSDGHLTAIILGVGLGGGSLLLLVVGASAFCYFKGKHQFKKLVVPTDDRETPLGWSSLEGTELAQGSTSPLPPV